jgi:NADH:ubiquinone oxidoreductase subunit C
MHSLFQLSLFSDLLVSDFPNFLLRFLIIYNIVSLEYNNRFLFKGLLNIDCTVDTIVDLYNSAT